MSSEDDAKPEEADEVEAAAAAITSARTWPVTVTLRKPIQFGKELIESLEFRDGCAGDLRNLNLKVGQAPTDDQLLDLAGRMCGRTPKALDRLSAEDCGEVKEIALGFWVRSQPGGRTR